MSVCKHRRRRQFRLPVAAYLADSFELTVAGLFVVAGASLMASKFAITLADDRYVPIWLATEWAFSLVLSGVLITLGLLKKKNIDLGRAIERAGLYIALSTWASFLVVILFAAPGENVGSIVQAVLVIFGCGGRAYHLRKTTSAVELSLTPRGDST